MQEKPYADDKQGYRIGKTLLLPKKKHRWGEGGLRTQGWFKKSFEKKPLISIITVVYNGETYLEKTIQSVINQSYDNVEYIIIDGGSTDGTVEIIKKYENQIDYWVSEPDKGIYDAMNKGLMLSQGNIIGIINADDYYTPEALEKSIECLWKSGSDYVIGKVQKIHSRVMISPIFPLHKKIYQGMMYPHIGALVKREVYEKVGLFNTKYRISADFDMAMRIHTFGFKAGYCNQMMGYVLEGGVSFSERTKWENMHIAIRYGRCPWVARILYFTYYCKSKIRNSFPKSVVRWIGNR
jgi:glycosyltransferase involved in cell wall biosynthesis